MGMRLRSLAPFVSTIVAIFIVAMPAARAEKMHTASSLSAGRLALGAEFQASLVRGTPLVLNLHEMVGLIGGVDLFATQGIGLSDQPFYIGAGIKWTLLRNNRDRPGVALIFGGHYLMDAYAGADATILADYTINRVTPYLGFDTKLDFTDPEVDFKCGLLMGIRIALVTNVAWFVEGGVGFTGSPRNHFISTGPKITI